MPKTPRHQAGRTNLRLMVSLAPEARENIDKLSKHTGIIEISRIITWAVEKAVRDLPKEPKGRPLIEVLAEENDR